MSKALVINGSDFSANKLTTVTLDDSIPCTSLSLSTSSISFTTLGDTQTITATKMPTNTTDNVSWGTSDASVATVSNGVITAVGEGTATITATCGAQTATCSISIVNEPEYVLVASYNPYRRGVSNHAATVERKTAASSGYHILAANDTNTSVLPVEDKDGQDTGDWRFVPLVLPMGATGLVISSEYPMKTRFLWFDNTKVSDVNAKGAWVVAGNVSDYFDQDTYSTSITLTKPSDAGINSFASLIHTQNHSDTANTDVADIITVTYTYE